jgi:hypothetical protein
MASNATVALGGLAEGLGSVLQHKQDQEHQDKQKHLDMITNLVADGIKSGRITDPEAAFQFLVSGGKPGGKKAKPLPEPLQALIGGIQAHNTNGDTSGDTSSPGGATPDTTSVVPKGAPGAPSTVGDGVSPAAASPAGTGPTANAPSPATPTAQPGGPGFRFFSGPEMDDRAIQTDQRRAAANVTGTYETKVALARRMVSEGVAPTIEDALERVGLKEPRLKTWAPRPVGRPVPVDQVPEGALTASGVPIDRTAKNFQAVVISSPDGTFETRYEPSAPPAAAGGAGGGADPARVKTKRISIKAVHPEWTDEQVEAEVGKQIQAEDAGKANATGLGNQQKGESLGNIPTVYDKLPTVELGGDGIPDADQQKTFVQELQKLPQGGSILANLKQAADYKMPSNVFTSRQIGGLNRERFISLVRQYDPTFDESSYKRRQDMHADWQTGKTSQTMASAKKIVNHMSDLAKASKTLDSVSSDVLGGMANPLVIGTKRVLGDKKAQDALKTYKTVQNTLALELRRLFATTGSGSQQEVEDWLKLASPYGTSTERQAFVKAAAHLMYGQVMPKVEQFTAVTGKPPTPDLWLNAADRKRLRAMGVSTSDLPPIAGETDPGNAPPPPEVVNMPNGSKATLPDGTIWMKDKSGALTVKRPQ